MAALNLLDFSYCGLVLRRNLDTFHDAYDGEPSLFDDFIPTEHDEERSVQEQVCPTLGHMAADIDMTDTSVTQSFSSIWKERPLSDSTPPMSPTVSREPFQFHGVCHSNDSSEASTPLSGELLWSLGSLSVLNVFVKTPERYEHVAVPLSSDLYMVREKAYVDYIPCPGSGPGSPALSVLSEAALPEIEDDFPRIDDSRPVITEIEPVAEEEETSKTKVPKVEIKSEERSILQPSQTRDWLATVLEKRQATPENDSASALLKEQAAVDEEQLKRAVYVLRIMAYLKGGLKLTRDTGGINVAKPSVPSHVSTSAPVCVPVSRRKVARSRRIRRRGQHHHHLRPFRSIRSIRRIKSGLVEGKEFVDADHHHRESEQGEEAAPGKLDRVLSLLPSSTHACPLEYDGGTGHRGSSKPSTSSSDYHLNPRQVVTKPDIELHPASGRASQLFDGAAERATGCLHALRPLWATKHHCPQIHGNGVLESFVRSEPYKAMTDTTVFVPHHYKASGTEQTHTITHHIQHTFCTHTDSFYVDFFLYCFYHIGYPISRIFVWF